MSSQSRKVRLLEILDGKAERTHSKTSLASSIQTLTNRKADSLECPFSEELLELILSKLPFPLVFKARLLSRYWYFKFPLPSQRIPSLSPTFQNLVISVSSRWPAYCPVYLGKGELLGFDRASSKWKVMAKLDDLVDISLLRPARSQDFITCAGSLLCTATKPQSRIPTEVVVTNALTRSYRKLEVPKPRLAPEDDPRLEIAKVLQDGCNAYKVVMLYVGYCGSVGSFLETQIYDSISRTWTITLSEVLEWGNFFRTTAYFRGELFCLRMEDLDDVESFHMYSYQLECNTWKSLFSWAPANILEVDNGGVLLCGDNIMVALCFEQQMRMRNHPSLHPLRIPKNSFVVYQLNLDTLDLDEVSTGPPETMVGMDMSGSIQTNFASDADFIYFGQRTVGSPVVTYELQTGKWDCLPAASYSLSSRENQWCDGCAYKPGLNPFVIA